MNIMRKDPLTRLYNTMDIDVTFDQIEAWQNGMLIQKAMPNLTDDEREFIKTGLMPDSWDKICGQSEEDT